MFHVFLFSFLFSSFFLISFFFFFNDTATTEIYTLSLHDALPICPTSAAGTSSPPSAATRCALYEGRSEEHTSELQSRFDLVCRLLLEKKKSDEQDRAANPDDIIVLSVQQCIEQPRHRDQMAASRSSARALFFFNDTATTEIYTLSLHDALPILQVQRLQRLRNVHDMAEVRVEAYTGKSYGGGNNGDVGAVAGSRDWGIESV